MWILTPDMAVPVGSGDHLEHAGDAISVYIGGDSLDWYRMKFKDGESASAAWKRISESIRNGYRYIDLSKLKCDTYRSDSGGHGY